MKKTTVLTGLVLVLISGIIIGAVGQLLYLNHNLTSVSRMGLTGFRIRTLQRLSEKLQLSGPQKTTIDAIISKANAEATKASEVRRRETEELVNSTITEIEKELTSEQQKTFRTMCKEPEHRHPDLKTVLNLSTNQEARLTQLRKEREQEMEKILTPEQLKKYREMQARPRDGNRR